LSPSRRAFIILVVIGVTVIGGAACARDERSTITSAGAPADPAAVGSVPTTTSGFVPTPAAVGEAPTSAPPDSTVGVTVTEVIDGDTIGVTYSGAHESVRLLGIDTSEIGEAFSAEATAALRTLLLGRTVRLEFDVVRRDQYDRVLAFVWVGSTTANAEMLRLGLATLYTVPPNVLYVEVLRAAQDEARAARRGMWGAPARPPLEIVSIHSDAAGDDAANLNDEYVVFKTLVTGTLAGYAVEDQSGHHYDFPDRVFETAQTFTLRTGPGADTQTDLYWNMSGSAVWNNDGDTVKVLDPEGHVVVSKDY
jgi:micrococcal nuclease